MSYFGVRRQSEAATALWIPKLYPTKAVSPDASGLPPHSKLRLNLDDPVAGR